MTGMVASENKDGEHLEHQQRGKPGDLPDSSHYVDLIFQELYKPISKDHNPTDGAQPHSSTYITNKAGPKETALNRLQRTLPIWKRQLAAFTRLLDSSESQKEPQQGKYNAVLDAEGELEVATLYLSYDIARLCSKSTRSDDHPLQRLKSYRLRKIHSMLNPACCLIRGSYNKGGELHGHFEKELSPEESERRSMRHHQMITDLKEAASLIGLAIECIDESDWYLALENWKSESECITSQLEQFVHYIRPQIDALPEENRYPSKNHPEKLTKLGMNRKHLTFLTEMTSDRIDSIADSHGSVSRSISQIISLLEVADISPGAETYYQLIEIAQELRNWSEAPCLHVLLHLAPSITNPNEYPTQKDIKSWIISCWGKSIVALPHYIHAIPYVPTADYVRLQILFL
ncbi:hypothetical protein PSTT_10494 [Puccinia striiformis]|uniref:Uncharacterized protein n=1 Tax=Puccinia striiformis TaxID=27350 RepID=A0A2S4V443_9BASI|nr:hypothetical protein PSTT_10494 [Puccinia striiformis]